jgi:2-oxoglutarate dehydrogenase E1 component
VPEFGPNDWFVEEKYQQYLADPNSVDQIWRDYFADMNGGAAPVNSPTAPPQAPAGTQAPAAPPAPTPTPTPAPAAGNGGPARQSATPPPPPPPNRSAASAPAKPASAAAAPATQSAPTKAAPAKRTTATPDDAKAASAAKAAKRAAQDAKDQPSETNAPIRGIAAAVVKNMTASLEIPTATSVRAVPAKLISDNRIVINNFLKRNRAGKISFTHLIGYAIVKATADYPNMNRHYTEVDGKPQLVTPAHLNLGLAIDLPGKNGQRSLVVLPIRGTETMTFSQFWAAYEAVVGKARRGELTADDYAGTTMSLTNPGGIGTVHSVPRLMAGQGAIIGVGAMEYPAEFAGASERTIAELGVSKIMTLTSTYDHRIIQGAESGEFLKRIHGLLLGEDGFYDEVFASLRVPYEPVRWVQDIRSGAGRDVDKTAKVLELIDAYRTRGHLMADTDPLNYRQRKHPDLDVLSHGLTLWDLEREFSVGGFNGQQFMKLRSVLGVLRDSYCRTVGVEYMHIQDPVQRKWVQERVEAPRAKPPVDLQKYILGRLNAAEAFETFLQTKYIGQKRFSLEGGETVIAMLDAILAKGAEYNLDEIVIGMAHRGRLNVLANIVGKPYSQVFREFEGNLDPGQAHGSGDVKYHLGAEGKYVSPVGGNEVAVSLVANPSHLEVVDPVMEGVVRAKQDMLNRGEGGFTVMPLAIHGDAAFAGQGVVAETLNLSQVRGYRTGGTVHVIINNQVGFTTPPEQSRSSLYSTDVARMIQAPIFHVNGDDPEACIRVARLAFDYRQAFHKDVVIDLVCYRRRGHNEGDDPSYTQPLMYDLIEQKRSVRKLYTESLVGRGDITIEEAEQVLRDYQQQLERVFTEVREASSEAPDDWTTVPDYPEKSTASFGTAVSPEVMKRIADAYVTPPDGFVVHPKVMPQLQRRATAITDGPIDWGTGEILAFGSLLMGGRPVRLAGQDSRRGTFVSRFATIIDRHNADEWTPLSSLTEDQAKFYVYDSLLSEYAALGFEYGYSVARPDALVLWEAQFGDFVNGAQTVIDEFITSGETKWGQQSGVVMLLPHGYEGQGPDHSSARIERFLTMAAEDAFVIAQPSTPASYFHLLRQHSLGEEHRPLIVFTPKSMLKRKEAASQPEDFTSGEWRPLITDEHADPDKVEVVLLCSGRVTWDLMVERAKREDGEKFAIARIEQLYPRPTEELHDYLESLPHLKSVRWVQDEPRNMGPWPHYALNAWPALGHRVEPVTRPASSSPSVGTVKRHMEEQKALIDRAFEALPDRVDEAGY